MNYYDEAAKYLLREWSIIPIRAYSGKKMPAVRWKLWQTERPSKAQLQQWFTRCRFKTPIIGLAVICGPVSGGLVVRDFDTMEAYNRWAQDHPDLAATLPTVETNRGRHVYFIGTVTAIMYFADGELKGGGYVCLPPTIHPSGITYKCIIPFPAGPIPFIADVVAAGMIGPPKPKKTKPARTKTRVQSATLSPCQLPKGVDTPSALLARALAEAGIGSRNSRAVWLACQLRDERVPMATAEGIMQDYALSVPAGAGAGVSAEGGYTVQEAKATLAGIYATPARSPAFVPKPKHWHNEIPQWIQDLNLKPYPQRLVQAIADKCDGKSIDAAGSLGYCIIGYEDLANATGMVKETAIRRIKTLFGEGLIVLVSHGGITRAGELVANVYAVPGKFGALDRMRTKAKRPRRFERTGQGDRDTQYHHPKGDVGTPAQAGDGKGNAPSNPSDDDRVPPCHPEKKD
jgi:hypothetical protein